MPLTISNTVTSPTNAALQNKMNPQPLVPANGVYYGGQQVPAQGTAAYNQAAQNYQSSQRPATPATSSSYNPYPQGLFQGAISGLSGIGAGGGNANAVSGAAQNSLLNQVYNPVTGNSQATPAQPSITGLQNIANNQTPEVIAQQKAYNDFAQSSPYMVAAQFNPNVAADVASGRASLLGKTFADILAAKSQAVQNAFTGQGQQITAGTNAGNLALTGQGQQISAAENAGNLALTGQGQQISALNNAANLSTPQLGSYGQTYYNPLTGSPVGGASDNGGALNPLNNVASVAQQVLNGQISPSQAYAMGGNVPNFQGVLNQEILKQNPNANLAQLQGSFEAKQANTTTSGTTPVNAAAAAYGQAYPQLLDLQNTVQNVDQFGNLLLNTMVDKSGNRINPTDVKFANNTLANVRSELSSPQQAVFDNTFASLKSRISGLLAAGGAEIPTQITADANKILDGSLPLGSLSAVLQRISTEGNILLSNLKTKLNTSGAVIGAPQNQSGGSGGNSLGI